MKDYILSFIAGLITVIFIYPVLKNISFGLEYYKYLFFIVPFLWVLGIAVSRYFKQKWMREFLKFLIVGFLNTAIDFGILNLISMKYHVYSGVKILGVNPFSFIIAVTNSFFWNKYFTFSEKTDTEISEVSRFLTVTFIGLLINTSIITLIIVYVPFDSLSPERKLNIAKVFATAASLLWNFLGMKIFVFNSSSPKSISAVRIANK